MAQEWSFADFSVSWDKNIVTKEDEKIINYSPLPKEIRKMNQVSTKIVPLVVGCLGVVSGWLEDFFKDFGISDVFGGMQSLGPP